MIEAEANRIAMLNAATPRYGQCNRQALQLFELFACNESLSLGVPKGVFSFAKENTPFDPAARRRHFSRTCAKKGGAFFEKENLPLDNIDIR